MHEVDVCLDLIKDKKDANQFILEHPFLFSHFPCAIQSGFAIVRLPLNGEVKLRKVVVLDRYVKNVFNKMNK
jgi:hypothetical protein